MEYHVEVSGRVQGVGFRYFTLRVAEYLGINGWVRNTIDGKVEIVAQGNESEVKEFLMKVKKGPSTAEVTAIKIDEINLNKKYNSFDIKF